MTTQPTEARKCELCEKTRGNLLMRRCAACGRLVCARKTCCFSCVHCSFILCTKCLGGTDRQSPPDDNKLCHDCAEELMADGPDDVIPLEKRGDSSMMHNTGEDPCDPSHG